MLYPTTIFQPDDRDLDGLYHIASGNQHIFPFQVPFLGQQIITVEHRMPGSQDLSINAWFSAKPGGQVLFPYDDAWDHFRFGREPRKLIFWNDLEMLEGDDKFLEAGRTYYLNVHNLQNQDNGYLLTFSF